MKRTAKWVKYTNMNNRGWDNMGICKCKNTDCPKREICFRFKKADHPQWQSYTIFKCPHEDGWRYFMPIPGKESNK